MLRMQPEQIFHFVSDKWEWKDGTNVTKLLSVRGDLMDVRLRKVLRRDLKEEKRLN